MIYQFKTDKPIKYCIDCPCCEQELGKAPFCLQKKKSLEIYGWGSTQERPSDCPLKDGDRTRENRDIEREYLVAVLKYLITLFNLDHKTSYEFHDRVYEDIINKLYKADKFNVPCSVDFRTEKHINGSTFIRVKTILDYGLQYEVTGPLDRSGF